MGRWPSGLKPAKLNSFIHKEFEMKAIITAFILFLLSTLAVAGTSHDSATDKTDRQILGILVAINKNEIAASDLVAKRKVDTQVKQFAHMMVKEHTQNLHQTMSFAHKIGQPLSSDDSEALQKDGKETLSSLKPLKGKELETTFMDDMVKGHEAALQTIDDNLLKNVTNEKLKKQIEATRVHVEHHLQDAKDIQSKLQATA
jgi:putative membrane protein